MVGLRMSEISRCSLVKPWKKCPGPRLDPLWCCGRREIAHPWWCRRCASHVGAGAEALTDASQDDDLDIGVIVPRPHVFAHFGYRPIFFRGADQRIHALRSD